MPSYIFMKNMSGQTANINTFLEPVNVGKHMVSIGPQHCQGGEVTTLCQRAPLCSL